MNNVTPPVLQSIETFYVNEYEVNRYIGGPEEGGWPYDAGKFIACLGTTGDFEEAENIREAQSERLAEINEGRRPLHSVLSDGLRMIYIEDAPGADFPDKVPHYE